MIERSHWKQFLKQVADKEDIKMIINQKAEVDEDYLGIECQYSGTVSIEAEHGNVHLDVNGNINQIIQIDKTRIPKEDNKIEKDITANHRIDDEATYMSFLHELNETVNLFLRR